MKTRRDYLSNAELILREISDFQKNLREKFIREDVTSLKDTNTPDFKEGLVVYFSALPAETLTLIEEKLSKVEKDQKKIKLPKPKDQSYYGAKSFSAVDTAIKHLSEDQVKQNEKAFYYNALSVAKKIQSIYNKPVQADRGDQTYSKIRTKAVELIKQGYQTATTADKWCPADIYIYNDQNVVSKLLSAQTINIGEDSLNAQFQSNINNTTAGVTGISLKEEQAQAGKAASFIKVLTRKENYPQAPALAINAKYVLSIAYNYEQAVLSLQKSPQQAIGYIAAAHSSSKGLSSKMSEASSVEKQFLKILKTTFGADLSKIERSDKDGRYDKDKARELFAKKKIKTFEISSSLKSSVEGLYSNVRKTYENQYKKARKTFLDVLTKNNLDAPTETPDLKEMGMETLLKKTGCYLVAGWVLDGLNSEQLNIPPIYQTIIKERNAFVAMTAYAIGMAGVSPTFFKMVGNAKGGEAHLETFYGSGFLNLDQKEKVTIKDSPGRKGFFVEFTTTVKLEDSKSAKPVGRYKVSLDFRYAGEQINIEVSKLKPVE